MRNRLKTHSKRPITLGAAAAILGVSAMLTLLMQPETGRAPAQGQPALPAGVTVASYQAPLDGGSLGHSASDSAPLPRAKKRIKAMSTWVASWFKIGKPAAMQANDSYLRNYKVGVNTAAPGSDLLDRRRTLELQQEFRDLNRDYEHRAAFGLMDDTESQGRHNDRLRGFSRSVLGHMRGTQVDRNSKSLDRAAKSITSGIGKTPGAIAGAMYVLATGTPVRMNLSERWSLVARTNALEQRGGLEIASPLFNSSVDFTARPQDATSERFRLSVSRVLPLDISSGVSYGGTSGLLSTSLSRALVSNLSVVLSTQSRLAGGAGLPQGAAQFVYGFQF